MIRGLQAGFRESVAGVLLDLASLGVELIRIDCQKLGGARSRELTAEVTDAGFSCLTTVYDWADASELPPGSQVELRGECDINHPDHYADSKAIDATWYRALLEEFCAQALPAGLKVWGGAISNLNVRGLEWLDAANVETWPEGVGVSVHWYPHGDSPLVAHDGFRSREAEVDALLPILAGRPWIVSEFGYHQADRRRSWERRLKFPVRQWSDEAVRQHALFEWSFWERAGAQVAVWFQLNDGAPDNPDKEAHFGIRRADGSWKPVARTFMEGR